MRRYGTMGQRLFRLARGEDERQVHSDGEAKSVSAETTFFEDISDFEALAAHLRALSEKVARRLKRSGLAGQTVVLKLKTQDFKTRSRNFSLDSPRNWRTAYSAPESRCSKRRSVARNSG